jgi:hypothetical protein
MADEKCEAALARGGAAWPIAGVSLTRRTRLRALLSIVVPVLGGCAGVNAGGQTGEESGDGCLFEGTALSWQEQSPLGFSAEQLLALAEGEHAESFVWREPAGFTYGPESGAGLLTLSASRAGSARFARIDKARSQARCEDHVRIPLTVGLATAGGALDEAFDATLVATSVDEASVSQVLPSASLGGALTFTPESLAGRRFVQLMVDLRFRTGGFAGALQAGLEGDDQQRGTASFQGLPLACWGDTTSLATCTQ